MCDIKAFSPILNTIQEEEQILEIRCSGDSDYYVGYLEYYDTMFFRIRSVTSKRLYVIPRDKIIKMEILGKADEE
jgi:hypothetical protein